MIEQRAMVGARLDRLPASTFHWKLLAMIGGGLFLDGFDIYLASGVLGALLKSGWSTMDQNAHFISVTFAGMVVGSWAAGVCGDRYGRKTSYQINLLVLGLASLCGAFAPSMNWLLCARFVMGLGMGAEVVVGYSMLNEFAPRRQRGRWGASLITITNSSLFFSALLGYVLIPNFGWRWMFVIVGTGALVIVYARKSMPESPRWLESQGRYEEADLLLDRIEAQVSTAHVLPPISATGGVSTKRRSYFELFSSALISRTLIGMVSVVAVNTALFAFVSWVPSFLIQRGISVSTSLGYTVFMALGGPVGSALPIFLADKLGRKTCIVIFSLAAIILGCIYPYAASSVEIALSGFSIVMAVTALASLTVGIYIPELFPTELRMRGMGFCVAASRLSSALTPYVVVMIFKSYGLTGVLSFVSALLVWLAIVVGFFGMETKGISLEELDEPGVPSESEVQKGDRLNAVRLK